MPKPIMTKEQDAYLRSIAEGKSVKQCTECINREFGSNFTETQIRGYKRRYHILSGKKPYEFAGKHYKHPEHIREYILKNYKGTSYRKMSELIKREFDYDITHIQVRAFYKNNRLNSGLTGLIKKGTVPYSKGKKATEYMTPEQIEKCKKTQFKKGNKPYNVLPIGTVKEMEGFLYVKVADTPNVRACENWIALHRLMYEFYNGPFPQENSIIFLDRNKRNMSKENLMMLTKGELARIGKRLTEHSEINEALANLCKLEQKIYEVKRKT